jgi:hypothetical protein
MAAMVRRSWMLPASISARISSSVAHRTARSSLGSGLATPCRSPVATNRTPRSSVTELDREQRQISRQVAASKPVSSAS